MDLATYTTASALPSIDKREIMTSEPFAEAGFIFFGKLSL
jgi:hypothetical protein